jgi:uncharacterized repeat protein (TIGR04076 family)
MHELRVVVSEVLGTCTAQPAVRPGDYFTVRDGCLRIPQGGHVCLWALQSLIPILAIKEREMKGEGQRWTAAVERVQCADPAGRVVFDIMRAEEEATLPTFIPAQPAGKPPAEGQEFSLRDLVVTVDEVRGHCASGMAPGDHFVLRGGQIYIPPERHFCLYALQAVLPFLPVKQRPLADGDWLRDDTHFLCPDPAGNVVLRVEQI